MRHNSSCLHQRYLNGNCFVRSKNKRPETDKEEGRPRVYFSSFCRTTLTSTGCMAVERLKKYRKAVKIFKF